MSVSQSSPPESAEQPAATADAPESVASGMSSDRIDEASLKAAQQATQSAFPFAQLIYQRFALMSESLRNGSDQEALLKLGDSAKDLGDFFQFVILMREVLQDHFSLPDVDQAVREYQDRLLAAIESLNPALTDMDLVEVADIIDHDVLTTLDDYPVIHQTLIQTFESASPKAA